MLVVREAAVSTPPAPKRRTTGRGFAVYEVFTDADGQVITVSQSSAALADLLRVYVRADRYALDNDPAARVREGPLSLCAHLDATQARRLRNAINTWLSQVRPRPLPRKEAPDA